MKRYRIGASLEVRFEKTMPEFIKWIHKIGLNHIEVKRDHNFIYPIDVNEIRDMLKDYNITLGYHAPYRDFNLSSINPHILNSCIKQIKEMIEIIHNIGGDYVNTHLGYIPDYYPEITKTIAYKNCIKSVKEITKFANDMGVKLCIENDPRKPNMLQFGEQIETLAEIINEAEKEIYITFDIGHANTAKLDIPKFINRFKDRLYVVHIHDNNGNNDDHLPVGDGNINFEEIFSMLKNAKDELIFLTEMKRCEDIYKSKEAICTYLQYNC